MKHRKKDLGGWEPENEISWKILMKTRKTPYLIYSLLIHLILMSVLWQFAPKPELQAPFFNGQEIWIDSIKPTKDSGGREPEPIIVEPPKSVEPAVTSVTEAVPELSKPQPSSNTSWLTENHDENMGPTGRVREVSVGKVSQVPSVSKDRNPNLPTADPDELPRSIRSAVELPSVQATANIIPQGADFQVTLGRAEGLSVVSPTVDTPNVYYGGRRGDALGATGMGNTRGGGSTSGAANVGGRYVSMMKALAHELARAATAEKIDVVFILDETASMVDNIRGIRAYVHFLFDALRLDGHDATFGLVVFSDEIRTYKRTDDPGTFKNWLFEIGTDGGGDLSEAGLDALMAAMTHSKFRQGAQRLFVLASDAAFHDADYNGRSPYSLDTVIETLQRQEIRVDVIGLDYLPIKQIAMATGGTWRVIPGKGYLEYIPPLPLTEKMFSQLGTLRVGSGSVGDNITVYFNNPPHPKRLTLTWKVLNPLGERCYGPFTEHRDIPQNDSTQFEFTPRLDSSAFQTVPGIYTVIYRLENEQGHQSILRRHLNFTNQSDGDSSRERGELPFGQEKD